jgi:hypothetical protein
MRRVPTCILHKTSEIQKAVVEVKEEKIRHIENKHKNVITYQLLFCVNRLNFQIKGRETGRMCFLKRCNDIQSTKDSLYIQRHRLKVKKWCCALNYIPSSRYAEVLMPNTYECDLMWK